MNFWTNLIGEPRPATIKTEIKLFTYSPAEIISFVRQGLVTKQEVIDSNVMDMMFGDDLQKFIYPTKNDKNQELTLVNDQLTSP